MINAQNLRFIQIPTMTVASIQCISTSPETDSLKEIIAFIERMKQNNMITGIRHFGYVPVFNKCGNADIDIFERMITVPKSIEISKPFTLKIVSGGLYAAYTVPIGYFYKASTLKNTICASSDYEIDGSGEFEVIEEYLSPWNLKQIDLKEFFSETQIDILVKVKGRNHVDSD